MQVVGKLSAEVKVRVKRQLKARELSLKTKVMEAGLAWMSNMGLQSVEKGFLGGHFRMTRKKLF